MARKETNVSITVCDYLSLPLIYHSLTTPGLSQSIVGVLQFLFAPRSWACASSLARNPSWSTESDVDQGAWLEVFQLE